MAAPSSPLALTNLLAVISRFNGLSMAPEAATVAFGQGVCDLQAKFSAAEPAMLLDLDRMLTRFGWSWQVGFTAQLDLPAFKSAIQKLKWIKASQETSPGSLLLVPKPKSFEP